MRTMLYLILMLDNVTKVILLTTIFATFGTFITGMQAMLGFSETDRRKGALWFKRFVIALAILLSLNMIVPSTKQAAAIYLIPDIIANEQVQKLPENAVKLLNTWMEEKIENVKK